MAVLKPNRDLKLHSRRFYKRLDVIEIMGELNGMARDFEREGWVVQRGPVGTIILELADGFIYYVPVGKGIEELIFEKPDRKGLVE